jgi:DNA-binding MurR/RpiR family transcriptional regulator
MLERPQETVTASAAKLAELTGTSDATVVRTARSLGYDGLRDLRQSLVAAMTTPRDPAAQIDQRLEHLATRAAPVLDQVLADASALVDRLSSTLDEPSWQQAVDLLERAHTVWLYGIGPAGFTAGHHALQLTRLGRPAQAITATGPQLADPLMALARDDVVVVYAPLRMFREIEAVTGHAKRVGAPVIAISETLGPVLRDRVDVLLETPPSAPSAVDENLAGLLIAHALTLELARRDHVGSVVARQLLAQLRSEIAGGPHED